MKESEWVLAIALGFVIGWNGILTVLLTIQGYTIKDMRETINSNFKDVKRDVVHLDHRTKHLSSYDQKNTHYIRPAANVTGEY